MGHIFYSADLIITRLHLQHTSVPRTVLDNVGLIIIAITHQSKVTGRNGAFDPMDFEHTCMYLNKYYLSTAKGSDYISTLTFSKQDNLEILKIV